MARETIAANQPTYAGPHAAVCWSISLQTGYTRADSIGLGTLLGRTAGETFTMSFNGQGVVQEPKEPIGGLFDNVRLAHRLLRFVCVRQSAPTCALT